MGMGRGVYVVLLYLVPMGVGLWVAYMRAGGPEGVYMV